MFAEKGWIFRRAQAADATPVRSLVREVYAKYVPLMGRKPRPMTADYDAAIRDHQVWVLIDGKSCSPHSSSSLGQGASF